MITQNDLDSLNFESLTELTKAYGMIKLVAMKSHRSEMADRANNVLNAIGNSIGKLVAPNQTFKEVNLNEDKEVNPRLVIINYFKPNGKYYSTGEYLTKVENNGNTYAVFDEVEELQHTGKLPGLIEGSGKDYYIHVNCDNLPNGFPCIIHPIHKDR